MEKRTIVKKDQGLISISDDFVSDRFKYNLKIDNMPNISFIDENRNKNIDKATLKSIKIAVSNVVDFMVKHENFNDISLAALILKISSSRNEAMNSVNYILNKYASSKSNYYETNGKKYDNIAVIEKAKQENPDFLLSVYIKRILIAYFKFNVLGPKSVNINYLENSKIAGTSMDILLNQVGEYFPENSKQSGIYDLSKKIFSGLIDIVFEEKQTHLCWEYCKNSSPLTCPKIHDKIKKPIENYEFIKGGYQTFKSDGKLDSFTVTKCDLYEKKEPKIYSPNEMRAIRKKRENLRMLYFGTNTVEEAYVLQEDLRSSNSIGIIRGSRPTSKQLQLMRKQIESKNQDK